MLAILGLTGVYVSATSGRGAGEPATAVVVGSSDPGSLSMGSASDRGGSSPTAATSAEVAEIAEAAVLAALPPAPDSLAGSKPNELREGLATSRPVTLAATTPVAPSATGTGTGVEATRKPEQIITSRTGWVCEGASRIEDGSGSRWIVSRVSFLAENGYERLILHLERAGQGRGQPPNVTAEVMPAAKVARRFPALRGPRIGSTAVVLALQDGIKATLGLRGYRPRGLATLKEFSAFELPDGSTRLVIGAASDGCFRLRIPDWTGGVRHASAQVQLDVRS